MTFRQWMLLGDKQEGFRLQFPNCFFLFSFSALRDFWRFFHQSIPPSVRPYPIKRRCVTFDRDMRSSKSPWPSNLTCKVHKTCSNYSSQQKTNLQKGEGNWTLSDEQHYFEWTTTTTTTFDLWRFNDLSDFVFF